MKQRRIVLGVTGGIAAYKSAELVRLMVKAGWLVDVVLTEAGAQFVGPATFQALTNRPVYSQLWSPSLPNGMAHIQLTRGADALLIAPATADIIAKTALGLTDDLLSTLICARDCPLLVAPAMNRQMWASLPNQRNISQLLADGVAVLGPAAGEQACGEVGQGRMLEPEALMQYLEASFQPKILAGRRVLLTAGPTFERIDVVRGITNSSSGKMGFAIARAAWEAGAVVIIVAGETVQPTPPECRRIDVQSAQEMLNAVEEEVDDCDIFIAVAAVADYYVLNPSEQKIKKDAHILTLELAPNPDILASVATRKQPPFCVGFAAESENLLEYAEAKRKRKHLPLLAANLVQQAMGSDSNEIILLDDNGEHRLPRGAKLDVARKLIDHIAQLYSKEKIA